jgi:ribosomal protein L12E/L44/L45/RPP1/RPP2
VEQIKPSLVHVSQNCAICTKPLAVQSGSASQEAEVSGYHSAIRIISCSHMHGDDCLNAWLAVSNTCPFSNCNRMLFKATGESITEHDVHALLRELGSEFGETRVLTVVARLLQQQEGEQMALKMMNEVEMGQQKERDNNMRLHVEEEFTLAGENFVESDEDMDWDKEEGDGYEVENGGEDDERNED